MLLNPQITQKGPNFKLLQDIKTARRHKAISKYYTTNICTYGAVDKAARDEYFKEITDTKLFR